METWRVRVSFGQSIFLSETGIKKQKNEWLFDFHFKGAIDDILNINIAAKNYWLCRDTVE